jgi:DNA-directed RNA polymerase specialized sigma24 family protein
VSVQPLPGPRPEPLTPLERAQHKASAIELLMMNRAERAETEEHLDKLKRATTYFVVLARQYGVTNQEIADVLGVTEGAVRALVKRAEKPAAA